MNIHTLTSGKNWTVNESEAKTSLKYKHIEANPVLIRQEVNKILNHFRFEAKMMLLYLLAD